MELLFLELKLVDEIGERGNVIFIVRGEREINLFAHGDLLLQLVYQVYLSMLFVLESVLENGGAVFEELVLDPQVLYLFLEQHSVMRQFYPTKVHYQLVFIDSSRFWLIHTSSQPLLSLNPGWVE